MWLDSVTLETKTSFNHFWKVCEFGLGLSGNIPLKEWEGRYFKYESTKLLKSIAHAIAHAASDNSFCPFCIWPDSLVKLPRDSVSAQWPTHLPSHLTATCVCFLSMLHHHARHWGAQNAACVLGSFFQHKFVQLCGEFGEDTHLVLQRGRKKKWGHMMNFSSSSAAIVQNPFSAFKSHHLWSHTVFHYCTRKRNALVCFCPVLWASCVWNFLKAERVQ